MYALFTRFTDGWRFFEIVNEFDKVNDFEDKMLAEMTSENTEVEGYTFFKLPD